MSEHLLGVGLPEVGYGGNGAAHFVFEVLVGDVLRKVTGEVDRQLAASEFHGAESHLQVDVSVVADQILNG